MTTKAKNDNPAEWNQKTLEKNWRAHLEALARENKVGLTMERLRFQAEQGASYSDTGDRWSELNAESRAAAWQNLIKTSKEATKEMMPVCVQCTQCCRKGSPTLMRDDLELLGDEKIPWSELVTLRVGEPARSPYTEEVFYLPEERIKLREKPGTKTCVFLDEEASTCTIHVDRPMQCRAQACWDPETGKELMKEQHLTRKDILGQVETLAELLAEHDRRCSFERLRNAFEELKNTEGKAIDEVIDVIAFEDHFRHFVAEKLNIPENTLDFIFGRPLADRVRLFGFRIEVEDDGTRTLLPDED